MPNLSLDGIINVTVESFRKTDVRKGLNVGLIIGATTGKISASDRCKVCKNLADVIVLGYSEDDPEYKAAEFYFGQKAIPESVVIGFKADSETWVQALTACADKNTDFYGVYCAGASITANEHKAVADSLVGKRYSYFYDSKDANAISTSDSDVFSVMQLGGYDNVVGLYSETAYAGAALMGLALGMNTGAADSAYTLAYKALNGVAVSDLTNTQVENLEGKNGNCYIKRGTSYTILEKGVSASGKFFDEVIGLDQLAYDLQNACMDALVSANGKVPYTDAGALQFVLACNGVCDAAVRTGFIAPGVWKGNTVIALENGDTLESGYMCQTEPVVSQSAEAKLTRKAPPVYVCAILAGAIHSVVIRVDVE